MKKTFLAFFLCLFASATVFAQVSDPVSWSKSIKDLGNGEYQIELSATIDAGWHIYDIKANESITPTVLSVTFEGAEGELLGSVQADKPVIEHNDPNLGTYGYWEESVVLSQKVKVNEGTTSIKVLLEWMSCDATNCTPPADEEFVFELKASDKSATPAAATVSPAGEDGEEEESFWGVILGAIAAGFIALVTPCVFPMVPMTVSFFLKGSGSKAKGRMLAIIFGLSIIVIYTLPIAIMIGATYIFGGESVTADIFNSLATHWLPNLLFFAIFMIFAASFFGAFEIVIPSWIVNKSDQKSDEGGLMGVFFMALTLVLVSFSCTGPIVGSIIVESTQGEIWAPIITMLAFSTAFAIPFTIFAFFPSMLKNLPKSGGWLNTVKVVLGFIEVALAFKFLSMADQAYNLRMLDREVYLAIWIVVFFLLGLYLLGKIRFAHDTEEPYLKVKKLFMAMGVFAFVVYMIPGMWGAPLKALSGYLPPVQTIDFNLPKMISDNKGTSSASTSDFPSKVKYDDVFLHLEGIHGFFDLEEASAYAKKVNKPLLVDFTGLACVNCREMEANVLSDVRVKDIINENYVLVSLYVDSKIELPEDQWIVNAKGRTLKSIGKINANYQIDKYISNAQPYYITTDHEGNSLGKSVAYDKSIDKYIAFLEEGIANFKKNNK